MLLVIFFFIGNALLAFIGALEAHVAN